MDPMEQKAREARARLIRTIGQCRVSIALLVDLIAMKHLLSAYEYRLAYRAITSSMAR